MVIDLRSKPGRLYRESGPHDQGDAAPGSPSHEAARAPRVHLRTRLVIIDSAAIVTAWVLFLLLGGPGFNALTLALTVSAVVVGLAAVAAARLYRARVNTVRSTEFARLGPVALLVAAPAVAASLTIDLSVSVPGIVGLVVTTFVLLVCGRCIFDAWLRSQRARGRYCRTLVIVGSVEEADEYRQLLEDHAELGYRVAGFVGPCPDEGALPPGGVWLGEIDQLLDVLEQVPANGVLILSDALPSRRLTALVRELARAGVHVHLSGGLWGLAHRRIRLLPIAHEPMLYIEPVEFGRVQAVVKRLLDIVVGSSLLLLTLPVLLTAVVLVRLTDGGAALYRQPRVGLDGRVFSMLKLRTMRVGADAVHGVGIANGRQGPLFKANDDDPRVTKVGRVLRATSIDELPQLLNVVRGDMSLVGPRPALISEVEQFDEELRLRHRVRPGLTGLWQVEARDNPSFRPYRRLDLFYVENWSLLLDVVVLILTAEVVLARGLRFLRDRRPSELRARRESTADGR
jgi:exopolysaccharide biosynthesis polyprenyl glycosylphosphotransferase